MPGSPIWQIYCWGIRFDELVIYLASTKRGGLRIGLTMDKGNDCMAFFRRLFPNTKLIKDYSLNMPLIKGVRSILFNQPLSKTMRLCVYHTPFQRLVFNAVKGIGFGKTATYGDIAKMIGKPGGARAVGQALKFNSIPLILPCHRIVAANGLGGFNAGIKVKRYLLEYEKFESYPINNFCKISNI